MTRPVKQGVDYFPLDVDIDSDDKVNLVEAQYGLEGFAIVIKLFLKIYRNGYYYQWTEREKLLFVKKTGAKEELLEGVVGSCIKWGIFDSNKFKRYKVLTSRGIQRRYFEIVKRRSEVEVVEKYIIKGVSVYKNLVNVNNNPVNVCNNPLTEAVDADKNPPSGVVNVDNNTPTKTVNVNNNPASKGINADIYKQSKVKESKVKKSKKKESKKNQSKVEERIEEAVAETIEYLNKKTGKKFRYQNPETITLIEEKIDQGFDIDDFKKVIRIKTKEWLDNAEMNQYLRPPTLFGEKFESYLNQKEEESKEGINYKKL